MLWYSMLQLFLWMRVRTLQHVTNTPVLTVNAPSYCWLQDCPDMAGHVTGSGGGDWQGALGEPEGWCESCCSLVVIP